MMDDKEIKQFIRYSRNIEANEMFSIEKHSFSELLCGMIIKVIGKQGQEAERQLAALQRMERFLERLTFRNCVFHFQSQTLVAQDRHISILEQEKAELLKENTELKKRIK